MSTVKVTFVSGCNAGWTRSLKIETLGGGNKARFYGADTISVMQLSFKLLKRTRIYSNLIKIQYSHWPHPLLSYQLPPEASGSGNTSLYNKLCPSQQHYSPATLYDTVMSSQLIEGGHLTSCDHAHI